MKSNNKIRLLKNYKKKSLQFKYGQIGIRKKSSIINAICTKLDKLIIGIKIINFKNKN